MIVLVILVIVIAIAMGGFAVYAVRASSESAAQRAGSSVRSRSPLPPVESFHVRGDTASVVFAVPLGDGAAGDHLTDLLAANAVEVVREKVEAGLPLEDVHRIAVSAMRGTDPELLTTVDLPSAGTLPDAAPIVARDPDAHDPIAAVQAVVSDSTVAPPSGRSDTLDPVAEIVSLSSPTEAHLRVLGVDPSSMTLDELSVGFLRASGYTVEPAGSQFRMSSVPSERLYRFNRGSDSGVLAVVPHQPGEYPELDEKVLSEFSIAVAQANPRRAILVTDKFGPYAMYERERRDRRMVFVTRERLQSYVDSFDLG